MATLYKENRSSYRIQFSDGNGNRRSIRLGRVSKKAAETIRSRVEEIISCRLAGIPLSSETAAWLGNLPNEMLAKLSQVGFEVQSRHTAEELWTAFLAQKKDIEETTLDGYDYVKERFFVFFERKTDLKDFSPAKFEEWKAFLQTDYRSPRTRLPLVEATVAGTLTKAKAVFNWAVRVGWLEKSPLGGVGRGSFVNRKKDYHVTPDEYRRLLDACPCQDWRTIIALARMGGLHPCEILKGHRQAARPFQRVQYQVEKV